MYLIDTNVISEKRKRYRANHGVIRFFKQAAENNDRLYLSAMTIGELRRGVELIRNRGDLSQARMLETWLEVILVEYGNRILDFTAAEAQVWGRLQAPRAQNIIDKQIAAIALTFDLILVTRNIRDCVTTGVRLFNPFESVTS
ncbi:MAG: type II toxin-antitoxin system VapC family toxin [Cyanobacteria bacterium P01_F01_bin.33]